MSLDLLTLKVGLMAFWSLWLTVIFLTNLFDGLKQLGVLPEEWRFLSENYSAMAQATSTYSLPNWLTGALFGGATLWEGLAALLFWQALERYLRVGAAGLGQVNGAFAVSLGLWAAMIIADEVFRTYRLSRTHMLIFGCQALSLLIIHLLPWR